MKIPLNNAARKRDALMPVRRYHLQPGECSYCDKHKPGEMMPPHDASERCESGKHSHCSCDTCF